MKRSCWKVVVLVLVVGRRTCRARRWRRRGGGARIDASLHCSGNLEKTPIWFEYDAYQFANGVIFASAAVFDRFLQSSGVQFYHPSQVGWATAPAAGPPGPCNRRAVSWTPTP